MAGGFVFRKNILSLAIHHYADNYKIPLNFKIDHFSFTALDLSSISLEEKITIPSFRIRWSFDSLFSVSLSDFFLEIDTLDIPSVLKIQKKIIIQLIILIIMVGLKEVKD